MVSTPKNVTLLKIRFGFSSSIEKKKKYYMYKLYVALGVERKKENRCVSEKINEKKPQSKCGLEIKIKKKCERRNFCIFA